jgi:hypothetical protein
VILSANLRLQKIKNLLFGTLNELLINSVDLITIKFHILRRILDLTVKIYYQRILIFGFFLFGFTCNNQVILILRF